MNSVGAGASSPSIVIGTFRIDTEVKSRWLPTISARREKQVEFWVSNRFTRSRFDGEIRFAIIAALRSIRELFNISSLSSSASPFETSKLSTIFRMSGSQRR